MRRFRTLALGVGLTLLALPAISESRVVFQGFESSAILTPKGMAGGAGLQLPTAAGVHCAPPGAKVVFVSRSGAVFRDERGRFAVCLAGSRRVVLIEDPHRGPSVAVRGSIFAMDRSSVAFFGRIGAADEGDVAATGVAVKDIKSGGIAGPFNGDFSKVTDLKLVDSPFHVAYVGRVRARGAAQFELRVDGNKVRRGASVRPGSLRLASGRVYWTEGSRRRSVGLECASSGGGCER